MRGILHLISFFVAAVAGLALVTGSSRWEWSLTVYAVSLALMLGVSAIYHRGNWSGPALRRWQRADHAAIFVFIAGSYTPLCDLVLPPWPGHALLAAVWTGAALGVVRALAWPSAPRWIAATLYVALGWAMVAALPAVAQAIGVPLVALFVAGGALYTLGAVIYAAGWPNPWPRTFGHHELFHALTIGAAIAHFSAIAVLATR